MSPDQPLLSARHVRVILALSATRSLSAASEIAHLSKPALTRSLTEAEARLGVALFQRGWAGSQPTGMGDIVVAQFQRIVDDLTRVERDALGNMGPLRFPLRLRWRHLRAVAAVARAGSASGGARILGISQPAVSQALAELADFVEPALFRRRRTGLDPTKAAQALVALWDRVSAVLTRLPGLLEDAGKEVTGRVAVGMLPFSGQSLVLDALGEVSRRHPHVHLVAVPGGYDALAEALRRGEIDLMLGVLRTPAPAVGFREMHLYHENYMMIARADHPVHARPASIAALTRERWIVAPHGTPIRAFFDQLFRRVGAVPPAQSAEMFSFSHAEQMVEASGAIAMLCYGRAGLAALGGSLRPVDIALPGARVSIGATLPRGAEPAGAVALFLQFLKARIAEVEDV